MNSVLKKFLISIVSIFTLLFFCTNNSFGDGGPSCNDISWRDGNICSRKVTSGLDTDLVCRDGYNLKFKQTVTKDLASQTFNEGKRDVVANIWIIHNDSGSWKANTFERIEANSHNVRNSAVIGGRDGLGHKMIDGHTYGFLVTGLVRNNTSNEKIRSKIIWGKFSDGKWKKTGNENVSIENYSSKNSTTCSKTGELSNSDFLKSKEGIDASNLDALQKLSDKLISIGYDAAPYLEPTLNNTPADKINVNGKVYDVRVWFEGDKKWNPSPIWISEKGEISTPGKCGLSSESYVGGEEGEYTVGFLELEAGKSSKIDNKTLDDGCSGYAGRKETYDACKKLQGAILKYYLLNTEEARDEVITAHSKSSYILHVGNGVKDYNYDEQHRLVTIRKTTMDGKGGILTECNNGVGGFLDLSDFDNLKIPSLEIIGNGDSEGYVCGEEELELTCSGASENVTGGFKWDYKWDNGMTGSTIKVLPGTYSCSAVFKGILNSDPVSYTVKQYYKPEVNIDGELDIISGSGETELTCNHKDPNGATDALKLEWFDISNVKLGTGKVDILDGLTSIGKEPKIKVGSGTYACRVSSEDICYGKDEVTVVEHKKPMPILSCDVSFKDWSNKNKDITRIKAGENYTFSVTKNRGDITCNYSGVSSEGKPELKSVNLGSKLKTNIASQSTIECVVKNLNGESGTGIIESATCSDSITITNDTIHPTPNCSLEFKDESSETIDSYVKLNKEIIPVFKTSSEISSYKCYYIEHKNGTNSTIEINNFKLSKIGESNKNDKFSLGQEEKRTYTCLVKNSYNNTGTCTKTINFTNNIPKGYCGDGIKQRPNKNGFMEQCDSTIGCTNTCIETLNPDNDNGNDNDNDNDNGNDNDNDNGNVAYCGDGRVQASNGETCDGGSNCINCGIVKKPTKDRDPNNNNDSDYNPNNGYDPDGENESTGYCGRYIAGYKEVKLPCKINGEWNSSTNSIECAQEVRFIAVWKNIPKDSQGRCDFNFAAENTVNVPGIKSQPRGGIIKLDYLGNDCNGLYADSKQTCIFKFELKLNLNSPKKVGIAGLSDLRVGDFSYNGGYINQTLDSEEQESGLLFNYRERIKEKDGKYILNIRARSVVPFSEQGKTLKFHIKGLGAMGNVSQVISDKIEFKKPIEISGLSIDGQNTPEIGRDQFYNISFQTIQNPTRNINLSLAKNFKLFLETRFIKIGDGYKAVSNNIINRKFQDLSDGLKEAFKLKIDSNDKDKSNILDGKQTVDLLSMPISYIINDKIVKYNIDVNSSVKLSGCKKKTNGLVVEGGIQFDGKGNITGQADNFSDLSSSSMRNNIRKNAYELIRGRETKIDKKIGSVYYNLGNTSYKEIKDKLDKNDTVIIKYGNFIIDEDLVSPIGIIVLNDKYDIKNNSKSGNIYIGKDVKLIKSIIYSDGALLSRTRNGGIYEDKELVNQLVIDGSVFSRNTVGGAVVGVGSEKNEYKLPGGLTTRDFSKAEMFDLDYLRKVDLCKKPYSTKVKYNSDFQLNPPKGFAR